MNETDKEIERRKNNLTGGGQYSLNPNALDLGSDRCAAAWVSDHVCLDKSAQTLLNVSCSGSLDDYFLGD